MMRVFAQNLNHDYDQSIFRDEAKFLTNVPPLLDYPRRTRHEQQVHADGSVPSELQQRRINGMFLDLPQQLPPLVRGVRFLTVRSDFTFLLEPGEPCHPFFRCCSEGATLMVYLSCRFT